MTVDRGGLQYTIRIEDQFSKALSAFIGQVKAAKKELDGFGAAAKKIRKASAEVKKAAADQAAASKKQAAAEAELSKTEKLRLAGLKAYNRELLKQGIARRKAALEAANGFRAAQRLQTEEQLLSAAHRKVTKEINRQNQARALQQVAKQRENQLNDEARRKLGLMSAEQAKIYDTEKRLRALRAQANNKRLNELLSEEQALKRIQRAEVARGTNDILRRLGRGDLIRETGQKAVDKQTKRFERLRGALLGVSDQANRVSFTFRRLFGILAAFAAARAIYRGFINLVRELIRFNASIEQARLGVAALFTAVGDVRDIAGGTTTAAQGLELALRASRDQVALLRRDALKTAATFEQLLETFQVAVAPGLQAGLDTEQIRKFTLDISRAAAAIGLPQNQLAEEIRSLLQGTIQQRTTRIAVALGITNEDIRNAKEAGVLFEFLQDRFAAFDEAGEKALGTFNAIFTNLKGGIQQVLEAGGIEFFDAIKNTLQELFDLLINQDEISGILTPDPRAVAIVQAFSNALLGALNTARETARALRFEDLVGASRAAGSAIAAVAKIVAGLVTGFIKGIRDLGRFARGVAAIFKGITGSTLFDTDSAQAFAETIGRILTLVLGVSAALGVVKLVTGTIALLVGVIGKGVLLIQTTITAIRVVLPFLTAGLTKIAGLTTAISLPVLGVVAALVAIVALIGGGLVAIREWFKEATGVELKFQSLVEILQSGMANAFLTFTNRIKEYFEKAVLAVKIMVKRQASAVLDTLSLMVEKVLRLLGKVSDAARDAADVIAEERAARNESLYNSLQEDLKKFEEITEKYAEERRLLDQVYRNEVDETIRNNDTKKSITDLAKGFGLAIAGSLGPVFQSIGAELANALAVSEDELGLGDAIGQARTLTQQYEEMAGIIGTQRDSLEKQVAVMKELRKEAEDAQEALAIGLATLGIDDSAAKIREEILKSQFEIQKQQKSLADEQAQVEQRRNALELRRFKNQERIDSLSQDQRDALEQAERDLRAVISLEQDRNQLVNDRAILEARARRAAQEGLFDELRALDEQIKALDQQIEILTDVRKEQERTLNEQLAISVQDEEIRQKVIDSVLARIKLAGEERLLDEQVNEILRDRQRIFETLNQALSKRIRLIAEEALFTSQIRGRELEAELLRVRAARLQESTIINAAQNRLLLAEAEKQALETEIAAARQVRDRNLEDLARSIGERTQELERLKQALAVARADDEGPERELDLLTQINTQRQEINATTAQYVQQQANSSAQLAIESELIDGMTLKVERFRQALTDPFGAGAIQGIADYINEADDLFTKMAETVKGTFEGLADTLGQSITDALTGKGGNFREAFANFLASIAQQFITMFLQVAIARSIALGFQSGGNVGAAAGIGFAEGGSVAPRRKGRRLNTAAAFASAQGFAAGGIPDFGTAPGTIQQATNTAQRMLATFRPSNLDSRDRIPIWTQPGEFVVKERAVKTYGSDFLDMLNGLLLDPAAVRAIAGINRKGSITRRVAGAGAVAGGQISPRSGSPTAAVAGLSAAASGPQTALVLATESAVQQMLYGGRSSMLEFLRSERPEYAREDQAKFY